MKTADGKTVSFKEAEQQLKMRMVQEKRKAVPRVCQGAEGKANVSVDEGLGGRGVGIQQARGAGPLKYEGAAGSE
jgi:hypothetical protein